MIRVSSKLGNYIALLPDTLHGAFQVVVTEKGVCNFKSRWPCSRLPERPIRFEYAANGDLLDIVGTSYDGEDMCALSQNAQEFAERVIEKRHEAIKRDAAWRREIEVQ